MEIKINNILAPNRYNGYKKSQINNCSNINFQHKFSTANSKKFNFFCRMGVILAILFSSELANASNTESEQFIKNEDEENVQYVLPKDYYSDYVVVKSGDNLWNIAKEYLSSKKDTVKVTNSRIASTVKELMKINSLKFSGSDKNKVLIYPGDIIKFNIEKKEQPDFWCE